MAYKQSPGRMNLPKTGAGVPSALTMPNPDPKKPKVSKKQTDKKEQKPKATGTKFPAGYYNIPNAEPYKMNSDGSVQMVTKKGNTYGVKLGSDK